MERFEYDFDGKVLEVVKFHPWESDGCIVRTGIPDKTLVHYYCGELNESFESLQYLLIAWIAYKKLSLNQGALVPGVAKAMDVY